MSSVALKVRPWFSQCKARSAQALVSKLPNRFSCPFVCHYKGIRHTRGDVAIRDPPEPKALFWHLTEGCALKSIVANVTKHLPETCLADLSPRLRSAHNYVTCSSIRLSFIYSSRSIRSAAHKQSRLQISSPMYISKYLFARSLKESSIIVALITASKGLVFSTEIS